LSKTIPLDARLEIKFVTYDSKLPEILRWIKLHPAVFSTHHPDRQIQNIYFDTPDCFAFAENLSGVSARQKLRYRWYGPSHKPQAGQLELKRRNNILGWKEIYPVSETPSYYGARWGNIRKLIRSQVDARGKYWMDLNPAPILTNNYNRQYFATEDRKIRLTIDTQFQCWDQRFKSTPNYSNPSHVAATAVVEIKCSREDQKHASEIIQGIPARVGRHSKYMIGIKSFQNYLGI